LDTVVQVYAWLVLVVFKMGSNTLQAHQQLCKEWHEWVLGRKTLGNEQHGGQVDVPKTVQPDMQLCDNATQEHQLPANFVQLREMQKAALDAIVRAHKISQQQSRTTAVFVRNRVV
jgi:hypothetical protein